MEIRKIAVACFIGGALCCAVALVCAPVFWWLGLIAGMAGGYVSYEFREFCIAIPKAMRCAGINGLTAIDSSISWVKKWFSAEPRPFLYLSVIISAPFCVYAIKGAFNEIVQAGLFGSNLELALLLCFVIFFFSVFGITMFVSIVIVFPYMMAEFGAKYWEKCYWDEETEEAVKELKAKGFVYKKLTNINGFRWVMKGFIFSVYFCILPLWVYIAIFAVKLIVALFRFPWFLYRLTYSEERVFCALHGTLGGAVSYYVCLSQMTISLSTQSVIVIFGGLLGAAFGVGMRKILSNHMSNTSAKELIDRAW